MTDWVLILVTSVLAFLTGGLWYSTHGMLIESRENSKQNKYIFDENKRPRVIVYIDIDVKTNSIEFVIHNISLSPAYNVKIRYLTPLEFPVYHDKSEPPYNIENRLYNNISLLPPKKIFSSLITVFTHGTGELVKFRDFSVDAVVSYDDVDGNSYAELIKVDSSLTKLAKVSGDHIKKISENIEKIQKILSGD